MAVLALCPIHPPPHPCLQVAIKKVLQDKRFKNRELQIIRMMGHPNIVQLKHCFYTSTEKDEVYLNLVLEFVPDTGEQSGLVGGHGAGPEKQAECSGWEHPGWLGRSAEVEHATAESWY